MNPHETWRKGEAALADAIRAASVDTKTMAHTMQPCDAYSIARHLLDAGYVKVEPNE
jgi:hypothetical protein